MRTAAALSLLLVLSAPAFVHAEEPRLDRVDYANPKAQLVLGAEVGAGQRTRGVTRQLAAKGRTPVGTLAQIVRWVGRNLRTDRSKAKSFRTVDQILKDGRVGGDADRALVIGVMARVAGMPTVWVEALHEEWIRRQKTRPQPIEGAVGRVFLEVYLGGRWQLLDPVTAQLYPDHDVRRAGLPAGHVAFDKGGDPYALALANRFELWRGQVEHYLRGVQVEGSRWARKHDLLAPWRVYVVGDRGAATYARDACKTLGFLVTRVASGTTGPLLERAHGKTLLVTVSEGAPTLPKALWARYLGADVAALYAAGQKPGKPWLKKTLADGTRVILITVTGYGPVELAVSEALEG